MIISGEPQSALLTSFVMRTSKQTKEDRHTTHEMQRNKRSGKGKAWSTFGEM